MSGKKANPGYRNLRHVPEEMDEESKDNSGRGTALGGELKRGPDTNIAVEGPGIKKKKSGKEEEVSKKLKTKWRQMEEKDNKDSTSIINDDHNESTSASFVSHIIKRKVHNKEVWVPITADDTDKFMEITRAVTGPEAMNHLVTQIKLLTECPRHSESAQVLKNLYPDCYDQSGDLSNYGKIIKLVLEMVWNQTGTSTRRIEYQCNCVLIARFYKAKQDKEIQLRNANPGRRKVILGLFPNDISDSKILGLPLNATHLIVTIMSYLQPNLKELSMLIEEHLLIYLLNWSRLSAQLLRDMLARAKELKLQIPFKKVLDLSFIEEEESIAEAS
ncbi:MAG: hypothetical protein M1839_005498 [Geoglossum umbratile]|nr:MAG: hypothetical protein M1839_005498 [Geoglossum umbratile]